MNKFAERQFEFLRGKGDQNNRVPRSRVIGNLFITK